IPENTFKVELLANANAILREEITEISILSIDKMQVKNRRMVTVLNENGDHHVQAYTFHKDNIKILNQQARVYNSSGEEIEKFKKRHFEDRSYLSSSEMYGDSRISYLNYTPTGYPYTVVFEEEYETNSTVFRTSWIPLDTYNLSIEKARYILKNPQAVPFRFEERNMEGFEVVREVTATGLDYSISNVAAFTPEKYSPDKSEIQPRLLVALDEFSLVGVTGSGNTWKDFGKWQYEQLLEHEAQLPQETIQEIEKLTANAKSDREKAKIIYQYVQNNTRYISVQLGVGGWIPMPAAKVDELGYGDCKALTNYTRVLLESQNITSYYTVVYGGDRKNLDPEFPSMQGNHVILNIPQEDQDIWLECTSQDIPFDFLGSFTDDRYVLKLTPEGGELVKTPVYEANRNLTQTEAEIRLNEKSFSADITRRKSGIAYDKIYRIQTIKEKSQKEYYKEQWGYLGDFEIKSLSFNNDRDSVKFYEKLEIKGKNFSRKAGNRLLLPVNFLRPSIYKLPRDETRKTPIEIARGESYADTYRYYFPQGFEIESIPEKVELENEFGSLFIKTSLIEAEGRPALEVERKLIINQGLWEPEKYEAYYKFLNQIKSYNNQKAVIITLG
ncbi:MAG TPA: DUF3857 domain-containing protein, partial [Salegentibacter sp.]|uniref:DUF3857 domain-containing protein n=1 Tax=Salegentibacter sp. TaxID=1903072 RepID=UPI002F925211